MHDMVFIRENPDRFDAGLKARGLEPEARRLIDADDARKKAVQALQEAQETRNRLSKEIGVLKKNGDPRAQEFMDEVGALKKLIPNLDADVNRVTQQLDLDLARIPNLPADDVPIGVDEKDNLVERGEAGRKIDYRFGGVATKEHFELGAPFGMDFETGVKLAGTRNVLLRGPMAKMSRVLGQFMLDLQTAHGYTEVEPPLVVNSRAMFGTGQLPKFGNDLYKVDDTDLKYLIPTAEVPLTNMVSETILPALDEPMRFTALTPCFRSEAGAAGRDVRGMLRQHQFMKCELVSICKPEDSAAEHMRMLDNAEEVLRQLELPYRVVKLCTGDMGFSARKTYDLEVWLPGQNAYREIASISNCGDFQARRMYARYRDSNGAVQFVHTLNGSGLAVGRTLIAVLENYQNEDGSVTIPAVLQDRMGTDRLRS